MEGVVASYNMSFASDLETPVERLQFASEATFLSRLRSKTTAERRSFWINAKNNLKGFIESKNPIMVGLQEINVNPPSAGYRELQQMIEEINSSKNTSYVLIGDNVTKNNAGIAIIYDTSRLGGFRYKNKVCVDINDQQGRPLLMVLTDTDNLLINAHGAQDPPAGDPVKGGTRAKFNQTMLLNIELIQYQSKVFLAGRTPKNIFITGDFNDRFDAIKQFDIASKTLIFKGIAPKSCCYNWDSSCPDGDRKVDFGEGYSTCKVPDDSIVKPGGIKTSMQGTVGDEGAVANYRFSGDKVFGETPITDILIHPSPLDENGASIASDHELVYATFGFRLAGGGRNKRGTRRNKSRSKSKKQRKTRNQKQEAKNNSL